MARMMTKVWPAMGLALLASMVAAGCGFNDVNDGFELDEDVVIRVQELSPLCTVQVEGHGAVDFERDYLPSVIACENGNAPMEALKAQAVAARSYARYVVEQERRALVPTTRDQVYNCTYAQVEQRHRDAVAATAGQVLTHNGNLVVGFYVAGAIPSTNSCRPARGDRDPTSTEKWVTYNDGKTGSLVRGTPLGSLSHPGNRGAKSQNGATCLANAGWDYKRILRRYYGDDTKAEAAPGGTCGVDDGAPGGGGDVCAGLSSSGSGNDGSSGPSCTDASQTVQIMPRSAWNARPSRYNTGNHTPNRITVHHTVTANGVADGANEVRKIQQMHFNRNFHDVGYHALIAHDGTIYQGTPENKIGAHVGNQNTGNLGVTLLGTFHQNVAPSEAQLRSLSRLIRHWSDKYNIPINRTNVKGHGERASTLCPGQQVMSRFDSILANAKADALCEGGDSGNEEEQVDGQDVGSYRYVRVTGVDLSPVNSDSPLDGFEVDSIYVEKQDGSVVTATRVACSPGVDNPNGALGVSDNTSCDNRASRAAGVPPGADLIVELAAPVKKGDILYVTQAGYPVALSECSPNGTAKVSLSNDGSIWKVLETTAQGNQRWTLGTEHFVYDENDEAEGPGGGLEFIVPRAGHWYRPDMSFKVVASDPRIVKVRYEAEHDNFHLGTSEDRASNFERGYTYEFFGERVIFAIGLDASGNEVARREVRVTITDFDGTIPEDRRALPYYPEANIDAARAQRLATEGAKCQPYSGPARCSPGNNSYSLGRCWGYAAAALARAGIDWTPLANVGPCSAATVRGSAYGFRCNADANPDVLRSIGMQKIDVPMLEAPVGSLLVWDKGCIGFHAVHGHVEIVTRPGIACSDFCGRIRGNAPHCASVYVPIN